MNGHVVLKKSSPYADIFPSDRMPVLHTVAEVMSERGPGFKEVDGYKLDVEACTTQQLHRLAWVQGKLHRVTPRAALEEIMSRGLCIRATEVETVVPGA